MKNQLLEIMNTYNLTAAQLAEQIGIQPSRISHVLSGRNNPSYDFIYRLLSKYPSINAEWLITGKEPMYKNTSRNTELTTKGSSSKDSDGELKQRTKSNLQFTNAELPFSESEPESKPESTPNQEVKDNMTSEPEHSGNSEPEKVNHTTKKVERIVVFYSDKTFTEYSPES